MITREQPKSSWLSTSKASIHCSREEIFRIRKR